MEHSHPVTEHGKVVSWILEFQPIISAVIQLVSIALVVFVAWQSGRWALDNAKTVAKEDLRAKSYSRLYGQKQEYEQALKSYYEDIIEHRYKFVQGRDFSGNDLDKMTNENLIYSYAVPYIGILQPLTNSQREQLEIFANIEIAFDHDTSIINCIANIINVKRYNVSNPYPLKVHTMNELDGWKNRESVNVDSVVAVYDSLFAGLLNSLKDRMR